jgi:hypothetical protein
VDQAWSRWTRDAGRAGLARIAGASRPPQRPRDRSAVDLVPTAATAPPTLYALESAEAFWSVTNAGTSPNDRAWRDAWYLSSDTQYDPSDRLVAERFKYLDLVGGQGYSDAMCKFA